MCATMKKIREDYGFRLLDISYISGKSIGYISDLEHGRKNWSDSAISFYTGALVALRAKQNRKVNQDLIAVPE